MASTAQETASAPAPTPVMGYPPPPVPAIGRNPAKPTRGRKAPVRAASIEYDTENSLPGGDALQAQENLAPTATANAAALLQPYTLSQDSPFLPPTCSTQVHTVSPSAYERETVPLQERNSQPQDPLRLSGMGNTIPAFQQRNFWTSAESSQIESVEPVAVVKSEPHSQPNMDVSGYTEDVELVNISQPTCIVIDDSSNAPDTFADSDNFSPIGKLVNARVAAWLARPSDPVIEPTASNESLQTYMSCDDGSSVDGRTKQIIKLERPLIGAVITLEMKKTHTHREPSLVPFYLATSNDDFNQHKHHHQPIIFATNIDIQSIRYSSYPTVWSKCKVLQHNKLTVNLNPRCPGIFSVSVRDHHALTLFGMNPTDRGGIALVAALEHARKFRYGRKEPTLEYYRLTVTEKILQLFFQTCPVWPQDGGLVMLFDSKSSHSADGDEVRFEPFNYYLHSKRLPPESEASEISTMLMPGIAQKMRVWRSKLKGTPE
uniref:Uncharacterized protein n=1 Tax=Anopheles farauti TaxID=69004 RepID=A0A182QRG1_9DIPT